MSENKRIIDNALNEGELKKLKNPCFTRLCKPIDNTLRIRQLEESVSDFKKKRNAKLREEKAERKRINNMPFPELPHWLKHR